MPIYEWDFAFVLNYRDVLWEGFLGTLKIGFSSLGLGIVIGLVLAMMRLSRLWVVRAPAIAIIEFFRATPVLVLLFVDRFATEHPGSRELVTGAFSVISLALGYLFGSSRPRA